MSNPELQATSQGQWQDLERELQETWARLTAKQASMVEQLLAELVPQLVPSLSPAQSQTLDQEPSGDAWTPGPEHEAAQSDFEGSPENGGIQTDWADWLAFPDEPSAAAPDPEMDPDPVAVERLGILFRNAQSIVSPSTPPPGDAVVVIESGIEVSVAGTDSLPVPGEVHVVESGLAMPSADVAEWLDRLALERDVARAECERFRQEAHVLRSDLARRLAEIARLRRLAEKLRSVRVERDRLNADRALLGREATQLQTRLVEVQVALVEVEAELEDCCDRARAERQEWQQQRQELLDEAERRLSEQRSGFEAERQAWHERLETHRTVEREAESLRVKVKKLRGLYDETRQQRDELLRQVETLGGRCALLGGYLDESEAGHRASEEGHEAALDRLNEALVEALEETEAALGREAAHVAEIQRLQAALARLKVETAMAP